MCCKSAFSGRMTRKVLHKYSPFTLYIFLNLTCSSFAGLLETKPIDIGMVCTLEKAKVKQILECVEIRCCYLLPPLTHIVFIFYSRALVLIWCNEPQSSEHANDVASPYVRVVGQLFKVTATLSLACLHKEILQ